MSPTRMAPETVVLVKIGHGAVIRLTWQQFSDLGNCCKEMGEHGQALFMQFGSVAIEVKKPG